jgi:hypothetical protein
VFDWIDRSIVAVIIYSAAAAAAAEHWMDKSVGIETCVESQRVVELGEEEEAGGVPL